jgi:hypothetical protein
MEISMINPTKAVRRSLLALQLAPFVILMIIAVAQLTSVTTSGVLSWLHSDYGIHPSIYGVFALLCAALYGLGLLRMKTLKKADFISLGCYGLVSAPPLLYGILALYWQTAISTGFSLATPTVWLSLALIMLVIYYHILSFSLWLWEMEQRAKLRS